MSCDLSLDHEQLAQLAAQCAQAGFALHQKATRCRQLVASGQRRQADDLARQDGDLREDFHQLDFAEAAVWSDVCEQLDIELPPILDKDLITAAIQELYHQSDLLESLLQSYRRMNASGAPVAQRLAKLRQIAREDPLESSWSQDIRRLEQARLEEMTSLAAQADAKADTKALDALLQEARSGQWQSPVAGKLASSLQTLVQNHRRQQSRRRYEMLAGRLGPAYAAADERTCQELFDQWQAAGHDDYPPDESLLAQVQPAFDWLEGRRASRARDAAFERACQELERAVNTHQSAADIERLAAAARQFDRALPQALEASLSTRIADLARSRRRRLALKACAVTAALLLIGTAVALGVLRQGKQDRIAQWRQEIVVALDNKDLPAAAELLSRVQQQDGEAYASAEIQGCLAQYHQQAQQEQERQARFAQVLAQLAAADMGDAAADDLIKTARGIALTQDEKSQVDAWQARRAEAQASSRQQHLRQLAQALEELESEAGKMPGLYQSHSPEFRNHAQKLVSRADALLLTGWAEEADKARITAVRNSAQELLAAWRQQLTHDEAMREDLGRLGSLGARPADLAEALDRFVLAYPQHALSGDFAKALKMRQHWLAIEAWRQAVSDWAGRTMIADQAALEQRLAKVDAYLGKHPSGPDKAHVLLVKDYLTGARAAWSGKSLRFLSQTRVYLGTPLMTDMQVFRPADGKSYYFPEGTRFEASERLDKIDNEYRKVVTGYRFAYIVDAACKLSPRQGSITADEKAKPQPAPQAAFAKAALKLCDERLDDGRWETLYLRLAKMTAGNADMDAVLKAALLKMFLEYAADCTPFEAARIRAVHKKLDGLELDVAWMNPQDDKASKSRAEAVRTLGQIGSIQEIIAGVERSAGGARLVRTYEPVGVLVGDAGQIKISQLADSDLFCLEQTAQGTLQFSKVGMVRRAEAKFEPADVARFPQGSPIFARKE